MLAGSSSLGRRVAARLLTSGYTGLEDAVDRLLSKPPSIVSVDVFDTVVMRPVLGEPSWLLAMTNTVLGPNYEAEAQALVHQRTGHVNGEAPSIFDIYKQSGLTEGQRLKAEDEISFELENVRAVPGAAAQLDRLRQAGVAVQFTSDMHLSSETLTKLLDGLGLLDPADVVSSSSDHGVSKSSGELFERLFSHLPNRGDAIAHIGDNPWSDGAQALRHGLRCEVVRSATGTRYEKAMAKGIQVSGSAIAGAARSARLSGDFASSDQQQLFELGTQVPGQCFLAFLLWVREQCEEEGIRRIVFLSRDGELPLRMAEAMPADHWEGFELSYLHCARRVWQHAAVRSVGIERWITAGTRNDTSFIHHYRHEIPFSSLLNRIGLTPDDLSPSGELASLDPDAPLPSSHVESWEALLGDTAVRQLILERAVPKEATLLEYLKQERLVDDRLAFVDVGWRGQLAWMVSSLVKSAGGQEPLHLHFGGDHVSSADDSRAWIRRFALDDSLYPHPIAQPVACVEVFTGSGKARLVDYVAAPSGVISPVFDRHVPAIDSPARQTVWDGAITVAAVFPSRALIRQWGAEDHLLVHETRKVLSDFWNRPDRAEVRGLQHLFVEADDVGDSIGDFIAPYTLSEAFGEKGGRRKWGPGSLEVTWRPFRDILRIYFRIRDR